MLVGLTRFLRLTIALAVVILCFPFLSPYLPLGPDLQLAVDWLGLSGAPGSASQVWGWLILGSRFFSTDAALRLDAVSFVCAVLSALCYGWALYRLLRIARHRAEAGARSREANYELLARSGALLATLAFLLTPALFFCATHASVRMTQFALPLAAIALLAQLPRVKRDLNCAYLVVVIGFLSAAGALEGGPGLLFFPVIPFLLFRRGIRGTLGLLSAAGLLSAGFLGGLMFVSGSIDGFVRLLHGLLRTLPHGLLFDGVLPFLLLSVIPAVALAKLVAARRMTKPLVRRLYFGLWTLAVVALAAMTFASNPRDRGKAADLLVSKALADLGRDRSLSGDGTFDALILLKKPEWVRLVSTRREAEGADASIRQEESVTNAFLDVSILGGEGMRVPAVVGWESPSAHPEQTVEGRAELWDRMWAEVRPILRIGNEPGEAILHRWFETQANAIGEMARSESKGRLAERMFQRARGVWQ